MHALPLPFVPRTPLVPLYEDEHLLILDKPSGLLCVPGRGPEKQDCLSSRAQEQWPEALVVHRLDMATSGIVLMARNLEIQRLMSTAFAERRVHKVYEALVDGTPVTSGDDWQEISAPILLDWENRPIHIVDPGGKPSLTQWKLLSHQSDVSRLSLRPITGRTHQLRVHLKHIGFPILGDPLYGKKPDQQSIERLMLHACFLQLLHPVSGQELCITSNVPF